MPNNDPNILSNVEWHQGHCYVIILSYILFVSFPLSATNKLTIDTKCYYKKY